MYNDNADGANARIRVLIADDSLVAREMLSQILASDGTIEVIGTASNGQEAVEKVRASAFDAVIMDLKMPVMDGIQALGEIKKLRQDQPVILCSAYGEYRQDFSSWISDGYVVKSADTSELKETIGKILKSA